MRQRQGSWRRQGGKAATLLVLAAAVAGAVRPDWRALVSGSAATHEPLATAPVRRADLHIVTTAGGEVASANNTIIECGVERLEIGVTGQQMVSGGTSTILSLVPEGTRVGTGEVICTLDASDYEEMVRLQRMTVQQSRADHRQAELDVEVAKMAVVEFRDGLMKQDVEQMRGEIARAEADLERARDRLRWTQRMRDKGYAAAAQMASDIVAVRRAQLALTQARLSLHVYQRFSAMKMLRELESQVHGAEATLSYQAQRLEHNETRLANLIAQVESCTIRAPHDGFLIYANDARRNILIEPGMTVHVRQKLFYLPDLTQMEVTALIHESVVDEVEAGQRAKVQIEGLPDRELEGHVVSVGRLPTQSWRNLVPYFVSVVRLDTIPQGLRPGMSAEVRIQTGRRDHVLTVPPEALTIEDGENVCYVAGETGLERRPVKLGQTTRDLLEVTDGLEEGEEVVLDPATAERNYEERHALASADDTQAAVRQDAAVH